MMQMDRQPSVDRLRRLALAACLAVAAVIIAWAMMQGRDISIEVKCRRLYAGADTKADSDAVDRTMIPIFRAREVPAGGQTCGVLRRLGRLE